MADPTRRQLAEALSRLGPTLAGRIPDPTGIADALMLRMATVLLAANKAAYIDRARGGTDAAGLAWAPLSPSTVRQRRRSPSDRRAIRQRFDALTPAEKKALQKVSRDARSRALANGLSRTRAEAVGQAAATRAARRLGMPVKSVGDILSTRSVEILRDTGRLLNSLSQVVAPGTIAVGTNVAYAKYHHSTDPRNRLPRRPVVWDPDNIPSDVWRDMLDAMIRGLVADLPKFLRAVGGRP